MKSLFEIQTIHLKLVRSLTYLGEPPISITVGLTRVINLQVELHVNGIYIWISDKVVLPPTT